MLSLFAFHHAHRNKRGARSLPQAAGGATEQPTRGVGIQVGELGGIKKKKKKKRKVRRGKSVRVRKKEMVYMVMCKLPF